MIAKVQTIFSLEKFFASFFTSTYQNRSKKCFKRLLPSENMRNFAEMN